ncbi:hypothetical protein Tco_0008800 [Tanacetum coccineum]
MADLKFVDQHNMVACLEKTEENAEFHQIVDFLSTCSINYALTVSPTIYASYIEQFWNTATSKTVNSVKQIHAIVDGKAVVISESSVRSDLLFNDEDGIACLTNDEIFENLALMGYEQLSTKLTFQKGSFSPQWKFLIHTILHCISSKSTAWNEFSTNLASAVICLAKGQKFNFSKLIFDGMLRNLDPKRFLMYPRFLQLFLNNQLKDLPEPFNDTYETPTHSKKVFSNMARKSKFFSGKVTPLFDSMLVQNQAPEGEGSAIPPEPQPTPSTSQPNVSEPQTESLQTETPPTVSHELQTEAHIEQILPSPSTYQRKQRKTQKHRRAKKVTELPQTSVPLDHGADEAVHKEGVTSQAPRNHGGAPAQTRSERVLEKPNEPPLPEGHTSGSGEGRMEHTFELMENIPHTPHDSPLSGGTTPGSDEGRMEQIQELMETCTSLTKRVLSLEEAKTVQDRVITILKLRVKRLEKKIKARTPQPMKRRLFKGRVETSTDKSLGEDASKQGRNDDNTKELNLTDGAYTEVIVEDKGSGEKGGSTADQISTARPEVSAASVPVNVSAATLSTPPTTTTIFGDEDLTICSTHVKMGRSTTTLQPLPTIDPKDKGKGVLVEEEPEKPVKVKRRDQGLAQIESDAELAQRLHEEKLAELDRAQKERQKQEEATSAALAEEFDEIQARIDVDHELAIRLTHEEQEKYIIKERARLLAELFERRKYQLASRKSKIQKLYEREKKWIDDFKPIDDDSQQQAESTKKRPRADSEEESSKKQKLEEANDAEKEELRDSIDVVPRDDVAIDVASLATKYPIVDWKTHILNENMMYYQIIRVDGSSKNYKIFSEMLDDFDRQDVIDLHRLVNERCKTTSPKGYDLLLWGDLKTLFEPNKEDEIWKN